MLSSLEGEWGVCTANRHLANKFHPGDMTSKKVTPRLGTADEIRSHAWYMDWRHTPRGPRLEPESARTRWEKDRTYTATVSSSENGWSGAASTNCLSAAVAQYRNAPSWFS